MATVTCTKKIVLTLTEDEARWLKGLMQNKLNSGDEDPEDNEMRTVFWSALYQVEL